MNVRTIAYEPHIDGIRAIAVIAVVLYHCELAIVSGGFVGVDIFFVISGYLVTKILVREHNSTGRLDLTRFYARRMKRLFPAAFLMMAIVLLLGALSLEAAVGEVQDLSKSVLSAMVFQANHYFLATTDYFSAAAVEVPLLHMWSLSVEEQFYLVWPALLIAWTNCRTPFVRRVSIGLLVVTSFTLSVWLTAKHPSAAFHLVPSRAWEFGAGAVVGVASMGKYTLRSSTALFLTLTGLALIFSSVIGYDHATVFPGVAAIPPVLGTAALIEGLRHRPESLVGTVLANRGVVQVGLLSYGWYLWH